MITNIFEKLQLNHSHRLYHQIRSFIIANIENGKLNEGDQLPSEIELCHILHISRPPIRQAFATLVDEGYLLRKKRGGTFIRSNHVITNTYDTENNYHRLKEMKKSVSYTKVLSQKKAKGSKLIKNCLEEDKSNLVYLERIRFVDDKVVARVQNYFSFRRFPIILETNMNNESLYHLLKKFYGIELHHVSHDIQAIPADKKLAEIFKIEVGMPILRITTVAFTANNVPFDYSIDEYLGSNYVFHMDKIATTKCL
ncbi:MAG: GntR family transcriptional regulator [Erysipelotrichaceae bacterium]